VNISHTWIGDLEVELISPASTTVRLHDRSGGATVDIDTTYDSLTPPDGPGTMGDFLGENVSGTWSLAVSDNADLDFGTLNSWSLLVQGPAQYACTPAFSRPAGRIPDGFRVRGTPLTVGHAGGGDITLSWGYSCLAADSDFGIYEGTIGDFTSHVDRFCSTAGAPTMTFTPGAGNMYYLVVPQNGTREGSYGSGTGGAERGQGASACMTQEAAPIRRAKGSRGPKCTQEWLP
jgi:hypothetical protein